MYKQDNTHISLLEMGVVTCTGLEINMGMYMNQSQFRWFKIYIIKMTQRKVSMASSLSQVDIDNKKKMLSNVYLG